MTKTKTGKPVRIVQLADLARAQGISLEAMGKRYRTGKLPAPDYVLADNRPGWAEETVSEMLNGAGS